MQLNIIYVKYVNQKLFLYMQQLCENLNVRKINWHVD